MMNDIPVVEYYADGSNKQIQAFWWNAKENIHNSVFSLVNRIKQNQTQRKAELARFGRMYSNTEFERYMSGVSTSMFGQKLTFNVSKACVDTACAKISVNKTRPLFLTSKGSKKQQNRAKKLTQYIDGIFYYNNLYEIMMEVFRDGCIFGTGVLKFITVDNQIAYERVVIDEIVVDDMDGRLGKPRQMHQTRQVNREVLKEIISSMGDTEGNGVNSGALNAIRDADTDVKPNKSGVADLIEVVESWHLPSSKDATDGKHCICIKNFTLIEEDWKHEFFPFVFWRWSKPILGFYGEGLIAELTGIQIEINLLLLRIKDAQELMANPRIAVEEGSSVNTSHITDEIAGIIKYRGTPPTALNWTAMNPEIYNYLEYLFKKAFEVTGISQLSASSKKPAGLDSGVALREYQDIETERFSVVAESFQKIFLDISKITIAIQRELAEVTPGLKINVKSKKFIETIKWKEVDLDDDKYIMDVFPTNFLPRTPEGKLQFTQELIQSGYIEPDWALSLLDFPDLEQFFNVKKASLDDISSTLDKIVEDEEYTAPDQYMNLQLAIEMGKSIYFRSKDDGTSETSLELLQRFIDDCANLVQQATPPPPQLPPQGVPTAIPTRPVRSDLIPQVQQPTS